ncbi:MAG: hypothetical protein SGCHY_004304 [Lobulomycetales sp.]
MSKTGTHHQQHLPGDDTTKTQVDSGPVVQVVFKPTKNNANHHPKDYLVIAHSEEKVKDFRKGKTDLMSAVENFEVFEHQRGRLLRPSKAELEEVFGSEKTVDAAVETILKEGKIQGYHAKDSKSYEK